MSVELQKDKKISAGTGVTKPTKGFCHFCHSGTEAQKIDFLTDAEELILWIWLTEGGDSPEGAREVIDCCRRDSQAREFFLKEARK
jgi:hypothetical protein